MAYELKKKRKDGTTHVVLTPQVLLERLCALVPRPRRHLVTYHGVFAPAAGYRQWVVPQPPPAADGACRHALASAVAATNDDAEREPEVVVGGFVGIRRRSVPHAPGKRRRGRPRYSWAELMRRVYCIDVLVCPHCGGPRRLLAAVHDPAAIRRILVAMGLSPDPPVRSPPRGTAGTRLPW